MGPLVEHDFQQGGSTFGAQGVVEYSGTIVPSERYDRAALTVRSGTATIVSEPEPGYSGPFTIRVNWSYGWFGAVDYTLKVFTDEADPAAPDEERILRTGTRERGTVLAASVPDYFFVEVPPGFEYVDAEVVVLQAFRGTARLTGEPERGATGTVRLTVTVSVYLFGSVRYFVRVRVRRP